MSSDLLDVVIADDSYLWSSTLTEVLEGDPGIRVVARAQDGRQAVEETARRRPDLVLMDVHMPVLGGLEAIGQIMARCPTPILVMTSDPRGSSGELTFEALRLGALDLIVKDTTYPPAADFVRQLRGRVRELAQVKVIRHIDPAKRRYPGEIGSRSGPAGEIRAVAIVASTGGPGALATILSQLPGDFSAGLVVVQHLAPGFVGTFAGWLDGLSPLSVKVAVAGDRLTPGQVLAAPDGRHLVVAAGGWVHLEPCPAAAGHCPSGDRLLTSVARAYGPAALGLVLTGMGDDGARGLTDLRRVGGRTFAQDRESSALSSMPQAAREAGAVERSVPLAEVAQALCLAVGQGR